MTLTPFLRKLNLTVHISFSVGWLGAVVVFLALAITGLNSQNEQLVRACLLAMKISAWFVILPFCLTALVTGVVQAAWTKWGLFRHYWIVVKLFLTLGSTLLLLLHLQPINDLASAASQPALSNTEYASQVVDLIAKSGAAILVLLFITTISVFKPWGRIQMKEGVSKPWIVLGVIGLAFVILIAIHLFGGGMHGH